jgi:hypothetical protein
MSFITETITSLPSFNKWIKTLIPNKDSDMVLPYSYNKNIEKDVYNRYNNIIDKLRETNYSTQQNELTKIAKEITILQNDINKNQIYYIPSKETLNFNKIWNYIEIKANNINKTLKRIIPSYVENEKEWNEIKDEHVCYSLENNNTLPYHDNVYDNDNDNDNSSYDLEKGIYSEEDDNEDLNEENITSQYPPFGRG